MNLKTSIIVVLCTICSITYAQETAEKITDNFFKIYEKSPENALATIFQTNKYFSSEQTAQVAKNLNDLTSLCGNYDGYQLLQKQLAGDSFILLNYIVKYDRQPLKFVFMFYKPKDTWLLYNFKFDPDLDKDLEDAAKNNSFQKQ